MNILTLHKYCHKPVIYTQGTSSMWTDPHIGQWLLETHLNSNTDLASRKPAAIEAALNWALSCVDGQNLYILDLGCGPVLYIENLQSWGIV